MRVQSNTAERQKPDRYRALQIPQGEVKLKCLKGYKPNSTSGWRSCQRSASGTNVYRNVQSSELTQSCLAMWADYHAVICSRYEDYSA